MPNRRIEGLDHIGNYRFRVEIDGVDAGYFKGVDGLSAELEVLEFKDVAEGAASRIESVRLREGVKLGKQLIAWREAGRDGKIDRRDMTIILNDNAANEVRRWNLYGCWPKQWKGFTRAGRGNAVVTEEIVFVVEDLQIA